MTGKWVDVLTSVRGIRIIRGGGFRLIPRTSDGKNSTISYFHALQLIPVVVFVNIVTPQPLNEDDLMISSVWALNGRLEPSHISIRH